jgi:hypothetical protein
LCAASEFVNANHRKHWGLSGNSHASIDARFRDWDVCPRLTSPAGKSKNEVEFSKFWDLSRWS